MAHKLHWTMMKFICAPDSFKESMSAADAARSMAEGIRDVLPEAEIDLCPISDGGEGFAQAVGTSLSAQRITTPVMGPLGGKVSATWYLASQQDNAPATAIIEMATASGLELLPPHRRDPTKTSTFGAGQLIDAAIARGAKRIVLGVGGSATNDFACAAAQALGARFFDIDDELIDQPISGGLLERVARIDLAPLRQRTQGIEVTVACDVRNPLTGPDGAAYVYAPQKGATAAQVRQLDRGLQHIAEVVRDQLDRNIEHEPGAGAAGGMGGGAMAFFNATLKSGIELVLDTVRFNERARGCRLWLSGEGRLDGQSVSGKACLGVAQAAKACGVETFALVGALGEDVERTLTAGLAGYRVIAPQLSAEQSMRRGRELLRTATARLLRELKLTPQTES